MKQAHLFAPPRTYTRAGDSIVPPTGAELARAGAARAAEHANRVYGAPGRLWTDRAYFLFAAYARGHAEFTTEHVRDYATSLGFAAPPDGRAWGSIALKARARKIIEKTGRYVPARDPRVHGNPVCVWRSLVVRAQP